jgi:hypothetical protein
MSAESDGWTEISPPTPRGMMAFGASSDDSCTVAAIGGELYLYDTASGQWTMTQDTNIGFYDLSAQDEYHLFGWEGTRYWVGAESPPTVAAEQEWEGTDFSGDEWADWFGLIP